MICANVVFDIEGKKIGRLGAEVAQCPRLD